jgi:hypothetical protein
LTLIVLCAYFAAGAVLPAILRIMRTIKGTEDVTDVPATDNVYILADISMAIAEAIVKRQAPEAPPPAKFPGLCPLPKSFYRALDTKTHGVFLTYRYVSKVFWYSIMIKHLLEPHTH